MFTKSTTPTKEAENRLMRFVDRIGVLIFLSFIVFFVRSDWDTLAISFLEKTPFFQQADGEHKLFLIEITSLCTHLAQFALVLLYMAELWAFLVGVGGAVWSWYTALVEARSSEKEEENVESRQENERMMREIVRLGQENEELKQENFKLMRGNARMRRNTRTL